jgi:hypothetical protein
MQEENCLGHVLGNCIIKQGHQMKIKRVAPKGHPGWCRVSSQLITGPLQKHQVGKVRKFV